MRNVSKMKIYNKEGIFYVFAEFVFDQIIYSNVDPGLHCILTNYNSCKLKSKSIFFKYIKKKKYHFHILDKSYGFINSTRFQSFFLPT